MNSNILREFTSSPRADLRNWPSYQSMLKDLKDLNANLVWLMPTRTGIINGVYTGDWYNSELLWPSSYINKSGPENYLTIISEALHKDGIKIFAGDRPYPGWKPKPGVNANEVLLNLQILISLL
jgi:hypothetical protein